MNLSKIIEKVQSMPLRKGKKELINHLQGGKPMTLRQAIDAKCYDCSQGYEEEKTCHVFLCPLYRFGPYSPEPVEKRKISEKQKALATERIKQYHQKRKKKEA